MHCETGSGFANSTYVPLGQATSLQRHLNLVAIGAGLVIALLAISALWNMLHDLVWADIYDAVVGVKTTNVILACLATIASYLALIGYDILALKQLGERRVALPTAALASFVGQSFAYTLGFGVLTGGAVRLRLYSMAGLDTARIAAILALCTVTFWLGLAASGGLALVLAPEVATSLDGLSSTVNRWIGVAVLSVVAAYLVFAGIGSHRIGYRNVSIVMPSLKMGIASIALSVIDIATAALALYMLLPSSTDLDFFAFLAVFVFAIALGVVSHVPGGLGIFEAAMLIALPQLDPAALLGSLLLFRLVYYITPFMLALGLLAVRETDGILRLANKWVAPILPIFLPYLCAAAVFAGGATLLFSGVLPAEHERLKALRHFLPLPFIEVSHLFGSVIGLVLLIVASGLARRLASGWRIAVALLFVGAVFSLAKGVDYEEAIGCVLVLTLLIAGRKYFYRQRLFVDERPSFSWMIAALTVIAASIWLGIFVFPSVTWKHHLWWEFAYRGDAPRFVRATLAVVTTALATAVYVLVYHRPARHGGDHRQSLVEIEPIIDASPRTEARLAFLGDKRFLVNQGSTGLAMYARQGQSLIVMGDPVADHAGAVRDLVWRVKELADSENRMPVFYQVSTDHLPIYLDAGLALTKLGEEAWVDLTAFTLTGGVGRRHRQALARGARNGLTFEIVPDNKIDPVIAEMRGVSDAWLQDKGREKGFSLGFWSDEYIRRFDAAVIRQNGRMVAFANLWRGAGSMEFSIDLMRFRPDAPPGVMDMMIVALMDQAKNEGYHWFNLGMAPLSGLPVHRLASVWANLAGIVCHWGDSYFNFEGLHAYKEKFKPVWRPKYLAHPGGLALYFVLYDCTKLIAASPARSRALAQRPARRGRKVA